MPSSIRPFIEPTFEEPERSLRRATGGAAGGEGRRHQQDRRNAVLSRTATGCPAMTVGWTAQSVLRLWAESDREMGLPTPAGELSPPPADLQTPDECWSYPVRWNEYFRN